MLSCTILKNLKSFESSIDTIAFKSLKISQQTVPTETKFFCTAFVKSIIGFIILQTAFSCIITFSLKFIEHFSLVFEKNSIASLKNSEFERI